ncbi:Iron-containing redox enzyme [Klenkia marina]|uniref:Iron-containing redox enzyme n=1 Tax=Klenkia marina TaxID=1960309 RepID=A0A1G4Y8E3_9ACTN|nr:iron-containing redox enzyme family protein [Klenkia marina]SCX49649.1 Iron-containing redox enzyme [Klenkia marina]
MPLPTPRGPLSDALVTDLTTGALRPSTLALADQAAASPVPLADDDLQVALYTCYELHYRGFPEVDDRWEWDPQLLGLRAVLEEAFEAALHDAADPWVRSYAADDEGVDRQLTAMVAADDGPSLSEHMAKRADETQWAEFLTLRSVYHLKEADPHTWAIPRITGRAKAALVEIQADEYGGGSPVRMHSALFGRLMRTFDLDDTHGAHVDAAPAEVLATLNAMSLLGLHRRLRGAVVGHLALIEMTSTAPSRRYASGLRRLGKGDDATLFYDEHVEADAVHEQVALVDMCGSLVAAEPALHPDVLFGAAVALELECRAGARILQEWTAGRSALRPRVGVPA